MSDLGDAYADRAEGVSAVIAADTAAHRGDRDRVQRALAKLIKGGQPFTAEHVDRLVTEENPAPYNRLLIASYMAQYSLHGVIAEDFSIRPVPASRRCRHGSRLRWWRGTAAASEAA